MFPARNHDRWGIAFAAWGFRLIAEPGNGARMELMQLLKRTELWILLAAVLAGLFFVFRPHPHDTDSGSDAGATTTAADAPLQIHRCILTRDFGNAQLEIEAHVRNDSVDKLVLQPPAARLLTAKGREVPGFFLPFQQQPEVAAKSAEDVQLRYWLEATDLADALRLEVNGKSVEVKSAKAFDLNSMKNADKKTFNPGEW
jgi:hypothetical protein